MMQIEPDIEIERLRAEVTMLRGVMELEPSEVLREQR